MSVDRKTGLGILGVFVFLGLSALGFLLGNALIEFKQFERSVTVKGLSEKEFPADIVIWPIRFSVAENNLEKIYALLNEQSAQVRSYLESKGIGAADITVQPPSIIDKSAQQYGGDSDSLFRYIAQQTVVVYSHNIDTVRSAMSNIASLGPKGIVLETSEYNALPEYLFTRLNEVKPSMVEEATTKAREVAQKFAADSNSKLGKIKRASQGQFSISERDSSHPHIKQVRVVSTVEYYLSD